VATPPALTSAELEHFVHRGYVQLRGGLPGSLTRAWVEGAERRIAAAPERWVRRYDPGDPARDLHGFRGDDPRTWTWERLDLEGERAYVIADVAPRLWSALGQLLGAHARVATAKMYDYMAINLRDRAEYPYQPPLPGQDSWHLDDPETRMRLDNRRSAVFLIAYLSDVGPASGGTFLAPTSLGPVARRLAAAPQGVDFVDRAAGAEISRNCGEFVELTGAAGDVAIVHALMLHSSSANPSGRIRYMANPMIYDAQVLNFDPKVASSPVELAVARHL
jgi:hypothetical protein